MKVTVFKNPKEYITRDYDLSVASIVELEKTLISHCELCNVAPGEAVILIPAGELEISELIVKGTSTVMSMEAVAEEILSLVNPSDTGYGTKSQEKKCKPCGQIIIKKTNWDVLKELPLSLLDEHFNTTELCGEKCPLKKQCKIIAASDDIKFSCMINDFAEWLGKEAKQ